MRRRRSHVVRKPGGHTIEEAPVDFENDLQVPRQKTVPISDTGHRSSASGITVWLV